jgi:hypothetical protein
MIARWGPDEAFEYLMELGDEVRATRVITTFVEEMEARINCDNDDDERYLSMSMGYRNCYNWYLASLGYTNVRSTASGAFILGEQDEDGEAAWTPVTLSLFQHTIISGRQASQSLR